MDTGPDLLDDLRRNLASERDLALLIGRQILAAIGSGWTYRALAAVVDAPHSTLWDRARAAALRDQARA